MARRTVSYQQKYKAHVTDAQFPVEVLITKLYYEMMERCGGLEFKQGSRATYLMQTRVEAHAGALQIFKSLKK